MGPNTKESKKSTQGCSHRESFGFTVGSKGALDGCGDQIFNLGHLVLFGSGVDEKIDLAKSLQMSIKDFLAVLLKANVTGDQVDLALALRLDGILGILGVGILALVTVHDRYASATFQSKQSGDGAANTAVGA